MKMFSMGYILSTTTYHMKRSIDISIANSLKASKESPERSEEILQTLNILQDMKTMVEAYEKENHALFIRRTQE